MLQPASSVQLQALLQVWLRLMYLEPAIRRQGACLCQFLPVNVRPKQLHAPDDPLPPNAPMPPMRPMRPMQAAVLCW